MDATVALVDSPTVQSSRDAARNRIKEVLALGPTPDAVARALHARRIRGVPNTVRFLNPIVRLIRHEIAGSAAIDVMARDGVRIVLRDGSEARVPLPQAVVAFLDAFNRGQYPDLELSPEQITGAAGR